MSLYLLRAAAKPLDGFFAGIEVAIEQEGDCDTTPFDPTRRRSKRIGGTK
jgi:hypothetical protein